MSMGLGLFFFAVVGSEKNFNHLLFATLYIWWKGQHTPVFIRPRRSFYSRTPAKITINNSNVFFAYNILDKGGYQA